MVPDVPDVTTLPRDRNAICFSGVRGLRQFSEDSQARFLRRKCFGDLPGVEANNSTTLQRDRFVPLERRSLLSSFEPFKIFKSLVTNFAEELQLAGGAELAAEVVKHELNERFGTFVRLVQSFFLLSLLCSDRFGFGALAVRMSRIPAGNDHSGQHVVGQLHALSSALSFINPNQAPRDQLVDHFLRDARPIERIFQRDVVTMAQLGQ